MKLDKKDIIVIAIVVVTVIAVAAVSIAKKMKREVEFTQEVKYDEPVYADVVAMAPQHMIGERSDGEIKKVVCKARTVDGELIWVVFSKEDFTELTDVSVYGVLPIDVSVDTKPIGICARFHGYAREAEKMQAGMSAELQVSSVLEYEKYTTSDYSGERDGRTSVRFSQDSGDLEWVHAKIKYMIQAGRAGSIFDGVLVSTEGKTESGDYLCACVTEDDTTIWMFVSEDEYDAFERQLAQSEEGMTVYGYARVGEDIVRDIKEHIGDTMILYYDGD